MTSFKTFLHKLSFNGHRRRIKRALALHRRGEARTDGLTLIKASCQLEIEWSARDIHPWDRGCQSAKYALLFTEQALADTDAALSRLFKELPEVDEIAFKVFHPNSDVRILAGTVERSAPELRTMDASPRTRLWHRGVRVLPLP